MPRRISHMYDIYLSIFLDSSTTLFISSRIVYYALCHHTLCFTFPSISHSSRFYVKFFLIAESFRTYRKFIFLFDGVFLDDVCFLFSSANCLQHQTLKSGLLKKYPNFFNFAWRMENENRKRHPSRREVSSVKVLSRGLLALGRGKCTCFSNFRGSGHLFNLSREREESRAGYARK